jgi:hypothetical protein
MNILEEIYMSEVVKVEVDAVERWDIIERAWKIDWSERRPEVVDIDVAVKVQIDVVGSIIQEAIDRIQIEQIIAEQPPIDDPAVW